MIVELGASPAPQALFGGAVFWQAPFLWAASATVLIETPLFCLLGYRRLRDCLCFAGINVVSNLLLNESLSELWCYGEDLFVSGLVLGELLVLLLEFALCRLVVRGSGRRLFLVLLATNLASLLCGLCFHAVM